MRTMLIVDDDPAWRSLYAMEFKPRFRIVEAEDGIEALGLLDRAQPDVIVLDLRLPRLNGLDFLRALERRGLRTPVVVCSALVSDERGFAVPGVRAAQKAADLREVRIAVDDALSEAPSIAPAGTAAPSNGPSPRP
jgi:CheY-like chemotaxis protein